ncbi:hypothetical protein [Bradyrhizobium symbiodeficiens]|uniref:Uncharacterized protein n=1 Tax=Bradyrhizobium symbiodeficiens TaxID=1404367 RepID=A0AAJ6N4C5_9BRAD|nr:hypothetical protein [Bradyrhizobium symbiodeficiens]
MLPHTGTTEIETLARDTVEEHLSPTAGGGSANAAARLVRITEHYARMDYEGSGRPCLSGHHRRRSGRDPAQGRQGLSGAG